MTNRRRFLGGAATLPLAASWIHFNATRSSGVLQNKADWFMPDEGEPHECTWMAFGPSAAVWGKRLLSEARRNLATIAQSIARFEPVVMLAREEELKLAKSHFKDETNIEWLVCPLDDLWIRDYGAVYVINKNGDKAAVQLNFNGWGEKQDFDQDAEVAAVMSEHSEVALIETDMVLEGGGIEVDGHGTAIITESCVVNSNRNPGKSLSHCERELKKLLGLDKIIWLPGIKGQDITDGHTDFYARFTGPGTVVAGIDPDSRSFDHRVTKQHLEILQAATDAQGRKLKVVTLDAPSTVRPKFANDDFCAGYINFYVCNGAVIATEFGDARTDGIAREKLKDLFPGREVIMLNIDGIAAGGGGIHCATQQEPREA